MSRSLYMRRDMVLLRTWGALGVVGVGAWLTWTFGVAGGFLLVPALLALAMIWKRGRRPLFILDDNVLTLQLGNEQVIKVSNILSVVKSSETEYQLRLKSGEAVAFKITALEDEDRVQLGRSLKRIAGKNSAP